MSGSAKETLIISGKLVEELLPPADCIEAIDRAMRAVSRERASLPLRIFARATDHPALVAAMPGALGDPVTLGGKLIAVTQGQPAGMPSHQGIVVLLESQSGVPLAILDANAITALRTAAASAVAPRALAPPTATRLAILGTGEQAQTHMEAPLKVRSFESVVVWGRSLARARAFVTRLSANLARPIEVSDDAEDAVANAQVVCTVTSAAEPVLFGRWVRPGTHVNLVGASVPTSREADDELVRKSQYFVDYRPSTMAQAGELAHAFQGDAARMAAHIRHEIGEVLNGAPGRRDEHEVTVYKSLGIAAQDLAAAQIIYERALAQGKGVPVRL